MHSQYCSILLGVRAASQPHVREYDHNIARQSYFFSLTLTASPSLRLYFLDIITNTKCDYGFHYCSINQWGREKRHRKRFAVTDGLEAAKSSQISFITKFISKGVRRYEIVVGHTLNPSSRSGGALCYQTTKKW